MSSMEPVASALGSDLVPNRLLSIESVATARGSDLVANRVLNMSRVTPSLCESSETALEQRLLFGVLRLVTAFQR
jgi:hypothetical protein